SEPIVSAAASQGRRGRRPSGRDSALGSDRTRPGTARLHELSVKRAVEEDGRRCVNKKWYSLCWIALTATLVIMVGSPAGARSPSRDGPQQWQSLNAKAEKAYRAGDHSNGIAPAEKARDGAASTVI